VGALIWIGLAAVLYVALLAWLSAVAVHTKSAGQRRTALRVLKLLAPRRPGGT
jgi:hypothetical protein